MNIITTVGDLQRALSAYASDLPIVFTVDGDAVKRPYTDMCLHAVFVARTMQCSHVELNMMMQFTASDLADQTKETVGLLKAATA